MVGTCAWWRPEAVQSLRLKCHGDHPDHRRRRGVARGSFRDVDRSWPHAPNCVLRARGGSNGTLIGSSEAMRRVQKAIGLAAESNAIVLIRGETGTGKELVARALHDHSRRKNSSFIAVNCAAIPADLLESELFGHVKGSFTGATSDRSGAFRDAENG